MMRHTKSNQPSETASTLTTKNNRAAPVSKAFLSIAVAVATIVAPVEAAASRLPPTEEEAIALFESGDFEGSIAMFEKLYEESSKPNYLFNIGRIYEEDGQLEQALSYYDRFMLARGVELEKRKEASERITAIRTILDARAGGEANEVGSNAETQPEAANEDSDVEPVTEASGEPDPTVDEDGRARPTPLATTGYVLAGVGGLALIAGGVAGGLAMGDDRDLTGPIDDPQALRDRGQRRARTADGFFVGGGILAATGVTLIIVDVVRRKKAPSATAKVQDIRVSGGPGLFGLGLSGRM